MKLSSRVQELFATQFCIKSSLAKFESQKLPFLQLQRLSTLNVGKFFDLRNGSNLQKLSEPLKVPKMTFFALIVALNFDFSKFEPFLKS